MDRAQLLAHPETELSNEQKIKLDLLLQRRANHEPLAFIRGKTEFYGREFTINKHVLEPRPETETMIELLKQLVDRLQITDYRLLHAVDVGTGSGAIAITLKLKNPNLEVYATDISKKCLAVAKQNAINHAVSVSFLHGDLLEPYYRLKPKTPHLIAANLPYVPDDFSINRAALHEPKIAIFGGVDGLDLYRKLFAQIDERKQKPAYILTESLPFQHHALAALARKHGYVLAESKDFIQVFEL